MSRKKNTEPMIPCPSCGVLNRIASPFCKDCGDRIYKNGAAPTPEYSADEPAKGAKAFRNAINSLLFLAIVSVIGLAFWPYASLTVPVASDPGRQVERYLKIVENTLGSETELPVSKISQRNLNAFLGQNNDPDTHKLLGAVVSGSEIELIANEPMGPFNLSTRVVIDPQPAEGANPVSIFWIGHLPLPGFWAVPWTRSMADRFDLDLEPEFWNHLEITEVNSGIVSVTYTP
ncbi:hypothetical protein P0Y35_14180 [Kiritimatiellaeota bacterium B1221]|nr:hypothetical protein [Kiritimatiellaeota bacterium B1221]